MILLVVPNDRSHLHIHVAPPVTREVCRLDLTAGKLVLQITEQEKRSIHVELQVSWFEVKESTVPSA